MKPFEQAMEWLAEYEGGYADRPASHDPGGPTNRGITQPVSYTHLTLPTICSV